MEIRNVITNNKTGEILSDEIIEISDDDLDSVTGGVHLRREKPDDNGKAESKGTVARFKNTNRKA